MKLQRNIAYHPKTPLTLTAVKFETNLSDSYLNYFRHKGLKVRFKEIEDAIVEYPYINKIAVLFKEDNQGNRRLVAYVIPYRTFNQSNVMKFLSGRLEPYMIPTDWVCMDAFPLTPAGFIDKHALQEQQLHDSTNDEFIAPRNKRESTLAIIIQKLLKLDKISVTDNFLRLGGSSLHALKVMAAIRKELNVNIDIKYFFVYPTIEGLAAYLNSLEGIINIPYVNKARQPFVPGTAFHPTSIVPIKASGKKTPLYIVCGGGGTVFTFEKFAHLLDDDQPVYGFQQPSDMNELEHFPDTIEAIATKYVDEILMIDPVGPYALSGHCIGGAIALEMARKLQLLGKKIHLLAMFDVILTKEQEAHQLQSNKFSGILKKIKSGCKKLWNKIEFETFLLTRHPLGAFDYRQEKLVNTLNKIFHFKEANKEYIVFQKFEQKFVDAYAKYKVNYFSGDMIVFYAKDHYQFLDKDKKIFFKKYKLSEEVKNLWNDHADKVKIFEIDGGHTSMFAPLYSNKLAGLVQQHLNYK